MTATCGPLLRALGSGPNCSGYRWAEDRPLSRATWRACERGDHLLWFVSMVGVDRRFVALAAAVVAQGVEHLDPSGAAKRCNDTVIAWALGSATIEQVREAREEAWRAACAADSFADSSSAGYAASYAADSSAGYAADHAAKAASTNHANKRRAYVLRQAARRVRRVIPWRVVEAAIARHMREEA